jgi:RNA polymerase sigma-70 factor (ECF subfamily)
MMEDKELIQKYFAGDEASFQDLVKRYVKPIYNFVHSSVRDSQQAEDITQDVFIKVWTHLKRFDSAKNFKVWIYTIARNSVFDFLRKKKTVPFSFLEKEDEVYDVPDLGPLPDKILALADSGEKLDAALQKIPVNYREVLILYYQNGFNFREIAEILKTSANTIKSRHLRALAMLKKLLKKTDF